MDVSSIDSRWDVIYLILSSMFGWQELAGLGITVLLFCSVWLISFKFGWDKPAEKQALNREKGEL